MPDVGLLTPGADVVPGSPAAGTDDVAVLRAMLAAEAAWVRAQVRCGLVPADVATLVERTAADLVADDVAAAALAADVAQESVGAGNPVVPLVARLRSAVAAAEHEVRSGIPVDDAVAAVHAGLTSQDVLDSAIVLVLRDAGRAVDNRLAGAVDSLSGLAQQFRDTPALARTLTQPAVPTTFGARCAGWLQSVAEAQLRMREVVAVLPLAYGGAAGTLAATDQETADVWADELGLPVTAGPWHVTRYPVLRAAGAMAEVCAALGTVAADVLVGARAEVGELREPSAPGRGASSAMGHKRNPVLAVLVRRSALVAPQLLAQVAAGAGQAVDERPDGAWHAEWPALQQLARHSTASAHLMAQLLAGLEVDVEALGRNLRDQLGPGAGGPGAAPDVGAAGTVVDRVLARYGRTDGHGEGGRA